MKRIKTVNQNADNCIVGKSDIDIKLVVAAGALAGVLTLATAGIIAACRKRKSK